MGNARTLTNKKLGFNSVAETIGALNIHFDRNTGQTWQANELGFTIGGGAQWTIGKVGPDGNLDSIFTTWTPENGMQNCFLR